MKDYPSIPRSTGQSHEEFDAYVFDKLDGSNLRWEWSKKQGWYKFGTRTRLFDVTDPVFGCSIAVFRDRFSEALERAARENRWERLIAYTEFFGPSSFAGLHVDGEEKQLALIDLAPHKIGILGPREYLKIVEQAKVPHADYLGQQRWTRGFVERVRHGLVQCTFEGVVGKSRPGKHELILAKAKTSAWITKVLLHHGEEAGKRIVES